ncbi:hypothetical protein [Hymenobacter fodinae]|uniref:Lipocalin-like domain-containing protein n=1 Tax=Hymenobacter fodinae TaxID=2510796 RepID=A0A4Z0P8B4_9BACT|nr:hypothetical protein [Hymenobacter fodinae]TGE08419.1 hypothetical protein EU556_11955 [Hymenobacter fodinae]
MPSVLRTTPLLLLGLVGLEACHATADDAQPSTLTGTWRLAVIGGGITGEMSPVPKGSDNRLVFGSDSTYTLYEQSRVLETNTYRLRPAAGSSNQPQLLLKMKDTDGRLVYSTYNVTTLSARELRFMTPGGCPIISEYVRVAPSATASDSK